MKYEPETVGDHILIHVKQHYRTQVAAAKAWGIGTSYLNAIINGHRPAPKVILDALGLEWKLVKKETV